jgi:hypothetical protein
VGAARSLRNYIRHSIAGSRITSSVSIASQVNTIDSIAIRGISQNHVTHRIEVYPIFRIVVCCIRDMGVAPDPLT